MQIWAESGKSALPICNYSQILYQFLSFTQNLKRSPNKSSYIVYIKFFKYFNQLFHFFCLLCRILYQSIVPQRVLNILHLLLWTLLHLWILFLGLIIILTHVQTTHPLYLCNIRSMHIHTVLFLHILLNLLISSLFFWRVIALFIRLHCYLNLRCIFFEE